VIPLANLLGVRASQYLDRVIQAGV
jgi:hypothetical protein